MKKAFSILAILLTVSFCHAQSQIVKRIHLNTGAEVNIPINLVDSVRIIEDGATKFLKIFQGPGNSLSIAVSEIDSISHYSQQVSAIFQLGFPVQDVEDNVYNTILIGTQFWMKENLKTTRFADGTLFPIITDGSIWASATTPAWCIYNNDASNDIAYGKLYNWYTVVDSRNVCPTGWHVPTDAEWTILTDYLGGINVAGGKMKSVTGWNLPNTDATNESGFSGLPGGNRITAGGDFVDAGEAGVWWSSTELLSDLAWGYGLYYGNGIAYRAYEDKFDGFSVRCIKD